MRMPRFRKTADLRVTSGDADNEWSKILAGGSQAGASNALLKYVTVDEAPGEGADDRLLRALADTFAGGENAYEDIKVFLERHAIPGGGFQLALGRRLGRRRPGYHVCCLGRVTTARIS